MKKYLLSLLLLLPLTLWAQDNTWEQEEENSEVKAVNPDAKYLKGAVPLVDGRVVFTKHIDVPGKSAAQIYETIQQYMKKMLGEKNQLEHSKIIKEDTQNHQLTGVFEEWLVFQSSLISLDRTRFYYGLDAQCKDGSVDLTLSHIRYLYEENRDPQRYTAEEWITDKEAVNKKNTRLLRGSGKFRRKTIDRKDFLFNKIESLLK